MNRVQDWIPIWMHMTRCSESNKRQENWGAGGGGRESIFSRFRRGRGAAAAAGGVAGSAGRYCRVWRQGQGSGCNQSQGPRCTEPGEPWKYQGTAARSLLNLLRKSYMFMKKHLGGSRKEFVSYRQEPWGRILIDGADNLDAARGKGGIFGSIGRLMKTMVKSPFKAARMIFDGLMSPVKKALGMATKSNYPSFQRYLGNVLTGLGDIVKGATIGIWIHWWKEPYKLRVS